MKETQILQAIDLKKKKNLIQLIAAFNFPQNYAQGSIHFITISLLINYTYMNLRSIKFY